MRWDSVDRGWSATVGDLCSVPACTLPDEPLGAKQPRSEEKACIGLRPLPAWPLHTFAKDLQKGTAAARGGLRGYSTFLYLITYVLTVLYGGVTGVHRLESLYQAILRPTIGQDAPPPVAPALSHGSFSFLDGVFRSPDQPHRWKLVCGSEPSRPLQA